MTEQHPAEVRLALDILLDAIGDVGACAGSLAGAMGEVTEAGEATADLAAATAQEATAVGVAASGMAEGAASLVAGAAELEAVAADLADHSAVLGELAGWLLDLLERLDADPAADIAAQVSLVQELLSQSNNARSRAVAGGARAVAAGASFTAVGDQLRAMGTLVGRSADRAGHTARYQQLRVDAALAGVRDIEERMSRLLFPVAVTRGGYRPAS